MVVPLAWSRALEIVKLDSPCDVDHAGGWSLRPGRSPVFLVAPRGLARSGCWRRKKKEVWIEGLPTTSFGVKHLTPSKSSYTAIVDQSRLDFVARLCSTRYPIATSMSSAMLLLVLWIGYLANL